jgi:hypothetical protein
MAKANAAVAVEEAPAAVEVADIPASDSSGVQTQEDWGALAGDGGDTGSTDFDSAVEAQPSAPIAEPVAPVEQPQVQEVPAVAQAQPEPLQPQQQAPDVNRAELRQQYETQLTQYYGMDAETAMRLQTEPELVLPQLAAKVHLEVLDAVMQQLPYRVGEMVTQIQEATKRETEAHDTFFSAYPDLKGYKDAVLRVGQMYRAANPTANREQAVKAIGDFVRTSLGLVAPAPAAPRAPANPFVPAQGSGGGAPLQVKSEWEQLLEPD